MGPPAQALSIRRVSHIDIVDGVSDEYIAAAAKDSDPADTAAFERQVRKTYSAMARIAVEPTWARAFDFGAGPVPRFLGELLTASADATG